MNLRSLFIRHRWRLAVCFLIVVLLIFYFNPTYRSITSEDVINYGRSLPAHWFIVAFFVLPLFGFPISVLLVLAGIRLGFSGGMMLAGAGTFFHSFAAYHLSHGRVRNSLMKWLERHHWPVPRIGGRNPLPFMLLFAAIHGPPYVAKLYLMALTDIPYKVYLWGGPPVYTILSILPVGAGSSLPGSGGRSFYLVAVVFITVLGLTLLLKRRLTLQ